MHLVNAHGERLDATLHPGRPDEPRIVVIGHGVTSHKDRPWLIALAEAVADAGIPALRFSFTDNGSSQGSFADATIRKEVDDPGSVLDALAGRAVVYAGHSMGAAVGVLRAARDPRIRGLVSLAGRVHVRRFVDAQFGALRPGDAMFGKARCPLSAEFLRDARALGDVRGAAAEVAVPWLLVHGTADELVPLQDAHAAARACPRRAQVVELAGADHRFTGHEAAMADAVVAWLRGSDLGPAVHDGGL
ncbi:MAG TPA: alpha/beta hydrolase [Planctomycetota bacterium]|nr:alpha/beta hydrolase [Planctomycetota bacterium]